jgi:hypothetical protein
MVAALMWGAPSAMADPDAPVPPPAPVQESAAELPPPPPAPFDPLAFLHPAPPPEAPADPAPAAPPPLPTPPDGVPHLPSPEALPPGSTMDPSAQDNEDPNVSYLKDLWHAVQNQEISGKEALIMGLAQRGMDTPYPEQPPGPNVPVAGSGVAPAAPPPPLPGDAPPPAADAPPPAPLFPWLP